MIWIAFVMGTAASFGAEAPPPYIARGNEVEAHYLDYAARLEKAHTKLRAALKAEAPDLYKKITPTPPRPVKYGYQVLPKIIDKSNEPDEPRRATSTSYSWARTQQFIDWEMPKIEELEEKLAIMPKVVPPERRPIYEKMVTDYPELESNQRTIDNHVQYNRFWQRVIAEDRPRFDHLTRLHDMVLERQALLDKPLLTEGEKEREKFLARTIHESSELARPPGYLKIDHPKPNVWVVRVPLYTDIQDKAFLDKMKSAIEKAWFVEDRENTYKMKIELHVLAPATIYHKAKAPSPGEKIDITKHVEHFPQNGGVITTGANSTYAIPGRFVALGPQDIAKNVLAHEFGHILGFIDGYFRGYRDRGVGGFEVLEIVPDPDDIMSTPGTGRVSKYHFEKLIQSKPQAAAAPGPRDSR